MITEEIMTDVITAIATQLSLTTDDVCEDSRIIDDLGADSLDVVELTVKLEDKYSLTISDSELMKLKTVSDILSYIDCNLNNAQ